jgi:predicted HD phosphohydrolase
VTAGEVTTVDDLFALLAGGADMLDSADEAGNAVDQLRHGLQCAAVLQADGADDELVVAGLFHDIAHLVPDDFHVADHETVGAELVRPLLGDRVAELIALHVPAKRYLAATEAYELSAGSAFSLEVQGGAMKPDEAAAFAALPHAAGAIALRRADEKAKDPTVMSEPLDSWRPLVGTVHDHDRARRT